MWQDLYLNQRWRIMEILEKITGNKFPVDCKQGEQARLIPVMDWRETHLLGFFLAALQGVPCYSRALFDLIDAPKGKTQKVECFTEVVFRSDKTGENRVDGLIEISRGKTQWRGIVEAKMGSAAIESEQIERYLRLARENKVDAVITISNDFVARPTDSPIKVSGMLTKSVKLYHLSWWSLVTEALLIQHNQSDLTGSESFLLEELLRACLHPKSKIQGFTQMNKSWKEVVAKVQSGTLQKSDPDTLATVSDWMQEQKELALILSRYLGRHATLWLPSKLSDPIELRKSLTNSLTQDACLACEIRLNDLASPIDIKTEIQNRRHVFSMKLRAPEDKKSSKARLNWLTRQLKNVSDSRVEIICQWPGKTPPNSASIEKILEDPDVVLAYRPEAVPHAFVVALIDDLGGRYQMPKVFLERLEAGFLEFYGEVAVALRAWQPPAPKPIEPVVSADEKWVAPSD